MLDYGPNCAWCGAPVGPKGIGDGGVGICETCMARQIGKVQPAHHHSQWYERRWGCVLRLTSDQDGKTCY